MNRNSKQRGAIARVLKSTDSHPTAKWIYDEVKKEIPDISLGTVYRNLHLLTQEGELLELNLAGDISRYDGNTRNHHHFRCTQCDRIFDIEDPVDKRIDERVTQKTGFKVFYHRLEFHGLCKDCQSGNQARRYKA